MKTSAIFILSLLLLVSFAFADKYGETIIDVSSSGNVTLPTGTPYKLMKFNSHGDIGESDIYEKTDVLGYGVYIPTNENFIFGNNPNYARFKHSSVDNVLNYDGAVLKYLSAFSVYSYYLRDSGSNQMTITNTGEYTTDAITQDMTLSASNNISLRASVGATNKATLGRLASNWNSLYLTDDIKFYPSKTSTSKVYEIKRDISNNMVFTGSNKTQIRTKTQIGNSTDYTDFETDGTIHLTDEATVWKKNVVTGYSWRDNPDLSPSWNTGGFSGTDSIGYTSFSDAKEEQQYVNFVLETPADYKENSKVYPFVNYALVSENQCGSDYTAWKFEYAYTSKDNSFTDNQGRITLYNYAITEGVWIDEYTELNENFAFTSINSKLVASLSRSRSDTCEVDYALLSVGYWYEADTLGARTLGAK